MSTRFGLRIVENSIENTHFIFCLSFQNLRLGSIKLLQKIVASQKPTHIRIDAIFCTKDYLPNLRLVSIKIVSCDVLGFRDAIIFCNKFTPSQKKILQRGTKDEMKIFEALFKGVSTRFGLRTVEKSIENPHFIFCSSFRNRRLGSITKFARWYTNSSMRCDVLVFMGCYHMMLLSL